MRSKSFTLAIDVLLIACTTAVAQTQPTPPPKVGYIRFWDMLPPSNGNFQLLQGGKPNEPPIATAMAYRYSSYTELPVGKYRLDVTKAGSNTPLKSFEVDLRQDTFFTVLISPRSIDMYEDTDDPKSQSATLVVWNLFPNVSVDGLLGQKLVIQALAYGQSSRLSGLPPQKTVITLRSKLPNGKPAESSAEIDFRTGKRATALVIPDSYGRFRPRVTFDGKNL